mgnify:CR=1 FL=1
MTRIQLFYSRAYPGTPCAPIPSRHWPIWASIRRCRLKRPFRNKSGRRFPHSPLRGNRRLRRGAFRARAGTPSPRPSPGAGGGFSLRRVRHGMQRHERPGKLPHVHPGRERRQHGGQNHRLCHPAHAPVPRDENPVLNCPGSSHAGLPLFTYPSFLFQEMKIHGN